MKEILEWLESYDMNYYKNEYLINDDLSIDVKGNVALWSHGLKSIPIQFNKIDGWFDCSGNNLESLKGCPKIVNGGFYCRNNNLKNIKELFYIKITGQVFIPDHLKESSEWKLYKKLRGWNDE